MNYDGGDPFEGAYFAGIIQGYAKTSVARPTTDANNDI